MRLFLSDSFFDKFTDLPRNIQQNVRDFQRKFRDNSTSAAIHLEPISDFRDSTLRSARVTGAYRAILGFLGQDNFVLLYVDKHDDAYNWARNKKFQWNARTQTGQIIPVSNEEPEEIFQKTIPSAVTSEESIFDSLTDEQLLNIGVPEDLLGLVRKIKDLSDLDNAEKSLPHDAFENLFALFDGEDINDIIAEIEEGKVKEGEDPLLSGNNRRRFVEITDDEELAKIMEEGTEKWQIFLHPSQSKLVEGDYKGTVKVSGSAGTGKTIAALHRLKKLAAQPGNSVLFTTYTTALTENIKGLAEKLGADKQRYELTNVDKVLLEVAKKNEVVAPTVAILDYQGQGEHSKSLDIWREVLETELSEFDEDFLYDEYVDVILYNNLTDKKGYLLQSRVGRTKPITRKQRSQIWDLKEKYEEIKRKRNLVDRQELFNITTRYLNENDIHPYTHVIVDEFQDFSNPELRFLRALVKEGRNDMFLVGDPFQRVYNGHRMNFGAAGINVRGKRSMKLKVNYRTTEEIKRTGVSVLKGIKYDDLDGGEENNKGYVSLVHGDRPEYKMYQSREDELMGIMEAVESLKEHLPETGASLKDVCIAARTRNLLKDAEKKLHAAGIPYCYIEKGKRTGDVNGVVLCTFHSLKGLEFRFVILEGVNDNTVPTKATPENKLDRLDIVDQREALAHIRALLYVAITRGRLAVFISGYGRPTELLEPTIC